MAVLREEQFTWYMFLALKIFNLEFKIEQILIIKTPHRDRLIDKRRETEKDIERKNANRKRDTQIRSDRHTHR